MRINCLIFALIFGFFLYGDVMYEILTTTESGMGSSKNMVRAFIKGNNSRIETTSKSPMTGEITTINIIRLDKNVIWTLNTEKKQYSEINLVAIKPEASEESTVVTPEFKIEKTGEKKIILKKDCEKVFITMAIKSEGGNVTMDQTMWIAHDIPGYNEIKEFNKKLMELGAGFSSQPMMGIDKKSLSEFQKKINEIGGLPLEMDLNMIISAEDMSFSVKTHSTITKIETVPINQQVFEIPIGYVLTEQ